MTHKHILITLLVFSLGILQGVQAQNWKEDRKAGLVFGLAQPLALGGFNVEGVYIYIISVLSSTIRTAWHSV